MPKFIGSRRALFGGRQYADKLKALFGSSIVGYWPQGEPSGTVSQDISGRGHNGVYTGVALGQPGIGDGSTAALYDGATSFDNIYSAGLAADFNGQEGTLAGWCKVANAGVWADGVVRHIARFDVDGNNILYIRKGNAGNDLVFQYFAGAVAKNPTVTVSTTAFFHATISWSKAADQVKVYLNGLQQGATLTGLGVWAGAPGSTTAVIGSQSTTSALVWSGSLAHALLLNRAATSGEIAIAAQVP